MDGRCRKLRNGKLYGFSNEQQYKCITTETSETINTYTTYIRTRIYYTANAGVLEYKNDTLARIISVEK